MNAFSAKWDGIEPPNYSAVFAWRVAQLNMMRAVPAVQSGAIEYYRTRPVEFIEHWCDTYDPRNAGSGKPSKMPFVLFPRQKDFVNFLYQCVLVQNNGLIEKARDMGATWLCAAFSVWVWRFVDGSSVGWGSRKEALVDKLGDPDSIFEKMRIIINGWPKEFIPAGFSATDHMPFMRIINPENGASITGEAGDNIGRGGRKLVYFKDESAHYERPEKIEASLSDTTRVQIDISSVNGPGNVFHRKRQAGAEWNPQFLMDTSKTGVFVFDWRDHPLKTQAWYDKRRRYFDEQGLSHIFSQEVDRDYSASVAGVIIKSAWVKAAIDAHILLGFADATGQAVAGLDVADEGGDLNAVSARVGPILRFADAWGEGDTGTTARRAVTSLRQFNPISVQYDSVGVGAGVKSETNRLAEESLIPSGMTFSPWNAGATVLNPDDYLIRGDSRSPINKELFSNLKAQAWYHVARRFERTYKAVQAFHEMTNVGGVWVLEDDPSELISIPSTLPRRWEIEKELSQAVWKDATSNMKMTVNKAPAGTKSPNLADSIVMAYFPVRTGISIYTQGAIG